MRTTMTLAAVAAITLLSGCSAMRCGEPGPYMDAEAVEPFTVPEGMTRPTGRYRISIPAAADVVHPELRGQAYEAADGRLHCLDRPPPMAR